MVLGVYNGAAFLKQGGEECCIHADIYLEASRLSERLCSVDEAPRKWQKGASPCHPDRRPEEAQGCSGQ